MNKNEQNEQTTIKMVFVVTCFGKVVGVYANSETAFHEQMSFINKGRIAELVPMIVVYDL